MPTFPVSDRDAISAVPVELREKADKAQGEMNMICYNASQVKR